MPETMQCAGTDNTPIQFVEVPVGDGWRLDIIIEGAGKGNVPLLRTDGWTYDMIQQLYSVLTAVGRALEAHCSDTEPETAKTYDIKCPNCQGEFVMALGLDDVHVERGGV